MINYLLVVSVSSTILNIRLVELFIIHDKCKLCRLGECCDCLWFAINRMHWRERERERERERVVEVGKGRGG